MDITEVRIKLMEDTDDRLQGFCSITFDDCFVIRDLKIIEGANGPFVAMPSRKLTAHCPKCGCKNHLRAAHCNQCGLRLKDDLAVKDQDGRAKLYADIAHPINSACREMIQQRVIAEYRSEQERAKEPGYVSRYDDYYEYEDRPPTATRFPERTHVEPAESEPRGPHRAPGQTVRREASGRDSSAHREGTSRPARPSQTGSQSSGQHSDDRSDKPAGGPAGFPGDTSGPINSNVVRDNRSRTPDPRTADARPAETRPTDADSLSTGPQGERHGTDAGGKDSFGAGIF